jgi:NAD(P)H-dependent FMN reductase
MKVLGIAGSLRRASYNRALIEAAHDLMPNGMTIEPFELDDIPLPRPLPQVIRGKRRKRTAEKATAEISREAADA